MSDANVFAPAGRPIFNPAPVRGQTKVFAPQTSTTEVFVPATMFVERGATVTPGYVGAFPKLDMTAFASVVATDDAPRTWGSFTVSVVHAKASSESGDVPIRVRHAAVDAPNDTTAVLGDIIGEISPTMPSLQNSVLVSTVGVVDRAPGAVMSGFLVDRYASGSYSGIWSFYGLLLRV